MARYAAGRLIGSAWLLRRNRPAVGGGQLLRLPLRNACCPAVRDAFAGYWWEHGGAMSLRFLFLGGAAASTTIAVPLGTLALEAFAPTVQTPRTVAVPSGTLALQGFAPIVVTAGPKIINVPLGTLTLQAFAPVVQSPRTVAVPLGTPQLQAFAPTVLTTGAQVVQVPLATLTLEVFAPTVIASTAVAPPVVGGGGGTRRRLTWLDWPELIDVESNEEAREVIAAIKRKAREIDPGRIESFEIPRLPEIVVNGSEPSAAVRMLMARAQADIAASYRRLLDELDEEDVEAMLL